MPKDPFDKINLPEERKENFEKTNYYIFCWSCMKKVKASTTAIRCPECGRDLY